MLGMYRRIEGTGVHTYNGAVMPRVVGRMPALHQARAHFLQLPPGFLMRGSLLVQTIAGEEGRWPLRDRMQLWIRDRGREAVYYGPLKMSPSEVRNHGCLSWHGFMRVRVESLKPRLPSKNNDRRVNR